MYKLRRKLIPVLQASLEMFNTGSLFLLFISLTFSRQWSHRVLGWTQPENPGCVLQAEDLNGNANGQHSPYHDPL